MQDFSKKRYSRGRELMRFGMSAFGVVALLFLLVLSARAAWDMYGKFAQASEAHDAAQRGLEALKLKQTNISAAVEGLSSSRGVEQEVRERFGVAKPGEGEITIVRDPQQASSTPSGQKGLLERLWQAFFVW